MVMSILGIGILLTGFAFARIPGGFVPIEDQGYAIGVVQAPDGVFNETTLAINRQVAEVLRSEKRHQGCGPVQWCQSGWQQLPTRACFSSAPRTGMIARAVRSASPPLWSGSTRSCSCSVDGGRVFVVEPPSIPGYGAGGGFEFQLLDQSSGAYPWINSSEQRSRSIQTGNTNPMLSRVYTLFTPSAPQIEVQVDRDRMAAVDVDFGSAMQAFSVNFGGAYVNDTFQEGKVRRVYVQVEGASRATPERLSAIYVNNAPAVSLIPLAEFFTVEETYRPHVVPHFNLYRSIKIEGNPAEGKSSGQAITAMKTIFNDGSFQGLGFDWTGISREEVKAGSLAVVIFALGILAVFLVLFAQYESYADPMIILLTVPTAHARRPLFLAAAGEVLNVYAQVGLVMLIGLAAGNAHPDRGPRQSEDW